MRVRWAVFLVLVFALLTAATCIDSATGTHRDPVTGGVLGALGGILGGLGFPWATAGASVLGNLWLAVRNQQWAGAAEAAVAGFDEVKSSLTPEQREKVVVAQERVGKGARQFVRRLAKKRETNRVA